MANPILIEATRGGAVESRHRGAICVADADGAVVLARGEVDAPVFPRSAVKGIQALPLVESGAADRFGLTDAELALACASHNGEPRHVAAALAMLAKAGRGEGALECGAHWPAREGVLRAMAARGEAATAAHNNCSGKHAGFVCGACAAGLDPAGYVRASHPWMREVTAALAATTGARLEEARAGTDGCSIPTFPIPLRALALGFARFATGVGLPPARAAAARRLRAAAAREPFFVGGTGRFDTEVMAALGEKAFVKIGAEGVHCAALPARGLGVALKIDDGAGRAAEVAMAELLARLVAMTPAEERALGLRRVVALTNWNGVRVGEVRAATW